MSESVNPKSNKYAAAQQIVIEMIRAGKINETSADSQAREINTLYRLLVEGFDETHNR